MEHHCVDYQQSDDGIHDHRLDRAGRGRRHGLVARGPLVGYATRLDPEDGWAWQWLPAVLQRVRTFPERVHLDQDGDALERFVRLHWVAESHKLGLWGVFTSTMDLVGHCLASLELDSQQRPWVFIAQAEVDGVTPRAIGQQVG